MKNNNNHMPIETLFEEIYEYYYDNTILECLQLLNSYG